MKQLALILLVGLSAGCDRALYLQGKAFESDTGSFEFLERQFKLQQRVKLESRLAMLRFRMFERTREGPKEWTGENAFYPFDGEDGNFVASWLWGGWGEREWERLAVEKEGFEPVVIPGEALTREACRKFLLIRMKKVP